METRSCKDHTRSGHLSVVSDEDLDTVTNSLHPTAKQQRKRSRYSEQQKKDVCMR